MNSTFTTERMTTMIDKDQEILKPEMKEFFERWTSDENKYSEWEEEIDDMRNFAQERSAVVEQQISDEFDLDGTVEVTLNANPEEGHIRINSLDITSDLPE
jgi:hypothetical protein